MSDYGDQWIECTDSEVRIRGYYFPWGTKHIAYSSIRSMRRVALRPLRGGGRIWGTANPRYWASLDPRRPSKNVGFILDLGRAVRPFVTPDQPDSFEAAVRQHANLAPATDDTAPGPFI